MRRVFIGLVLSLISVSALAQQNQQQLTSSQQAIVLAYQLLGKTIDQLVKDQRDDLAKLTQHMNDLDTYLKACGDKPGCTVPAGK